MLLNRRLFVSPSALVTAIAMAMLALPLAASASEGTFDIIFADPRVTGTVTYDTHGSTIPSAIFIRFGGCLWTKDHLTLGSFASTWTGPTPDRISTSFVIFENSGFLTIENPAPYRVQIVAAGVCSGLNESDVITTYEIQNHNVSMSGPFGISLLTTLLGVAGIRKLRA